MSSLICQLLAQLQRWRLFLFQSRVLCQTTKEIPSFQRIYHGAIIDKPEINEWSNPSHFPKFLSGLSLRPSHLPRSSSLKPGFHPCVFLAPHSTVPFMLCKIWHDLAPANFSSLFPSAPHPVPYTPAMLKLLSMWFFPYPTLFVFSGHLLCFVSKISPNSTSSPKIQLRF